MTDCIYTGAYIRVHPYNFCAPADIFRSGDSLVLRINPECGWIYGDSPVPITHVVTLPHRENRFFWPFDTVSTVFTAVVPLDAVTRTDAARKPDLPEIS